MQKHKLLIIILILIYSLPNHGQSLSVSGVIVDSSSNEPLSFATAVIQATSDSSTIKGQIADENGNFYFDQLAKGTYHLKVSTLGYVGEILSISLENNLIQNIYLSPAPALLKSVIVSGQKSKMLTKLSKQVFDAGQFANAQGMSSLEILRNLPSISINAAGNISYRGNTGFLLLVNGTPSYTDPMTLLSQIGASNIESIELITAPSARYDADGKAGIINIVTKRALENRQNFTVDIQVGLPRIVSYQNANEPYRYSGNLSYAITKAKWDVGLSANFQRNDIAGQRIGDVYTLSENTQTFFPSQGERSFRKYSYAFRARGSYNLSTQSHISIGAYHGRRDQLRLADIHYQNRKQNSNTVEELGVFEYFNSNLVQKTGNFTVLNADYETQIDKKNKISFSALYEGAEFSGFTKNRNLNQNNFQDTLAFTRNTHQSPLSVIRLKTDYGRKLKTGQLLFGYQYRHQIQNGTYLYEEQNIENKTFDLVDDFSADVSITNRIHALYSEYNLNNEDLQLSAGLRFESAIRNFDIINSSENNEVLLNNFFPSFNILKPLKNDWSVKAGLSRRVQRSTNNELNPFPEREHSETLEQGDPLILPEFVTLTEIGASKDFNQGNTFFTFYRQDIENVVNRVNSVFNDTIINRIYTNVGKATLLGLETGTRWKPTHWWEAYLGTNAYQLRINGNIFERTLNISTQGWVFSLNTTQSFTFQNNFSAQLSFNYLSQRVTAQGEDSRFFLPNLIFSKGFMNNRLLTSFQWQNIALGNMKTNQQRITTRGTDFFSTTNYIQETNILRLNLSYRIKQNFKSKDLPKSEIEENEY